MEKVKKIYAPAGPGWYIVVSVILSEKNDSI